MQDINTKLQLRKIWPYAITNEDGIIGIQENAPDDVKQTYSIYKEEYDKRIKEGYR